MARTSTTKAVVEDVVEVIENDSETTEKMDEERNKDINRILRFSVV